MCYIESIIMQIDNALIREKVNYEFLTSFLES